MCDSEVDFDSDQLVSCDACGLTVHQSCYGVPDLPGEDDMWLCRTCELKASSGRADRAAVTIAQAWCCLRSRLPTGRWWMLSDSAWGAQAKRSLPACSPLEAEEPRHVACTLNSRSYPQTRQVLKHPDGGNCCCQEDGKPAPQCCLCPVTGGALKPTTLRDIWCHVTCMQWIPEVRCRASRCSPCAPCA